MHAHRSNRSKQHSISVTNIEQGQDSQESILSPVQQQHKDDNQPYGQIRRTDNVTVQYEPRTNRTATMKAW
jgi:hypothetical protein